MNCFFKKALVSGIGYYDTLTYQNVSKTQYLICFFITTMLPSGVFYYFSEATDNDLQIIHFLARILLSRKSVKFFPVSAPETILKIFIRNDIHSDELNECNLNSDKRRHGPLIA